MNEHEAHVHVSWEQIQNMQLVMLQAGTPVPNPGGEHHVDVFREDCTPGYGWQCFTCGQEDKGFPIPPEAEAAGFRHSWKQILTGQEP